MEADVELLPDFAIADWKMWRGSLNVADDRRDTHVEPATSRTSRSAVWTIVSPNSMVPPGSAQTSLRPAAASGSRHVRS